MVEVAVEYQQEYERVQNFVVQLADAFRDASARSAFHVDSAQAEVVLEGLMNFEIVTMASISTDLDELLAERTRTPESGYMDAFGRMKSSRLARSSLRPFVATALRAVVVRTRDPRKSLSPRR